MFEALADACHWIGESMLTAVDAGHTDVGAVSVPKGLLGWIARIAQYLAAAKPHTLISCRCQWPRKTANEARKLLSDASAMQTKTMSA
jgi:hypothetical protein